jgi:hypothetical protein
MKIWTLFGCLFFISNLYCIDTLKEGWKITKRSSPLDYTVNFTVRKDGVATGKVVRTGLFTPRYFYDYYDESDKLIIRAITRPFSLGLILPWAIAMDLYEGPVKVGMICGKFWSSSRAKFAFKDGNGEVFANAYLNSERCNFMLFPLNEDYEKCVELVGKPFGDASIWSINPGGESLPADEKMINIFTAFAADYQEFFIKKHDTINHFHTQNQNPN